MPESLLLNTHRMVSDSLLPPSKVVLLRRQLGLPNVLCGLSPSWQVAESLVRCLGSHLLDCKWRSPGTGLHPQSLIVLCKISVDHVFGVGVWYIICLAPG